MKKIILVSILIGTGLCATNALGARIKFSDIPGDGVITCGPDAGFQPVCPGGVGTVRHPPQSGWLDELGRLKGGVP
jgi:hypothetical protein